MEVNMREKLEDLYGKDNVWNTEELQEKFKVTSFSAPFTFVTRKSDGIKGIVTFVHRPRFYFDFKS